MQDYNDLSVYPSLHGQNVALMWRDTARDLHLDGELVATKTTAMWPLASYNFAVCIGQLSLISKLSPNYRQILWLSLSKLHIDARTGFPYLHENAIREFSSYDNNTPYVQQVWRIPSKS